MGVHEEEAKEGMKQAGHGQNIIGKNPAGGDGILDVAVSFGAHKQNEALLP